MLPQKLEDLLPLWQLILLNRNNNICEWFLTNTGQDPLYHMVLVSRHEDGAGLDEAPEPPNGRYPCFQCDVWDESAGGGDSMREMPDAESVDDQQWQEAEPEAEP